MLFDTHTHTTNSDGRSSAAEMCAAAVEKGVGGILFTDHANMNYYYDRDTYNSILRSIEDADRAKEAFVGKLKVCCGVELGEYLYAPEKAKKVLAIDRFDAVLCSVHLVPRAGWGVAYNRINFDDPAIPDSDLYEYLHYYFDLLSETVDAFDFDILAHIHCPVRYTNGKYSRTIDILRFEDRIREILEKIIRRDIALEVNTARLFAKDGSCDFRMKEILEMYRVLGGRKVTLGSDAHQKESVGSNFLPTMELLKSCGFDRYYYYEKRIPREILL
jgi:histidinol-phosphatase (PHP family)